MTAVKELTKHISLNKSLLFTGVSKTRWYYSKNPRNIPVDPIVTDVVQKIGKQRPTYGTRRMAAQVSRELNIPVNRKKIQRIFHKLGWIEPAKNKKRDHEIWQNIIQTISAKPVMADRYYLCLLWH